MMRLGHYRSVHVKSKASQLLRTTLIARKKFVDHMLAIEDTIRGLMKVHGLKLGAVHRSRFAARVETLLADAPDLRRHRRAVAPVADLYPRLARDRPKGWPPKRSFSVWPNSRHLEDESGGPKSADFVVKVGTRTAGRLIRFF
jgi:hypothetical protein